MGDSHQAVLLDEVVQHIKPPHIPLQQVLDGTFGRGGHTRAILQHYPQTHVMALDCDEEAFYAGQDLQQDLKGRFKIIHGNFSKLGKLLDTQGLGQQKFSAILLDLGVSSPQLDTPERGFSFYHDGPLDMRMDQSQPQTATEVINHWTKDELCTLFRDKGDIRRPEQVVQHIINQRPFNRTSELEQLIAKATGWKKKHRHPATKYFMALRLEVNQELENLQHALPRLLHRLEAGGRLLIIFFHSLEGRIIKQAFKNHAGLGRVVNKNVIRPVWATEQKHNPRSRSAGLKIFERSL